MPIFSVNNLTAPLLLLCIAANPVSSFLPKANLGWTKAAHRNLDPGVPPLLVLHSSPAKRSPSRVTDEDGLTPDAAEDEIEEIDPDEISELMEIDDESQMPPGPIPHQPWRRGVTDGCEDPITAEWRVKSEDLIAKAAECVGGRVLDVTWYLTAVLVTLDDDLSGAEDPFKASGPVIDVKDPGDPIYCDPADPKPEDIWADDDEIVYQRETEEEAEECKTRKINMYAKTDENDPPDEPHIPEGEDDTDSIPLYMNEETRADAAYTEALEAEARYDDESKQVSTQDMSIDTPALSTIAGAIIEALTDAEEELRILSRHELVLSSEGPPDVLETQKQFDAHRGVTVIVETQDPWQSNRVLKGKLLDRNSMDVLINKKGRMVTIPLNFVKCVRVEPPDEDPEDVDYEDVVDDMEEIDE